MTQDSGSGRENPLGRTVGYDSAYDPGLLYPMGRTPGREALGLGASLPFTGCDVWNAWELSWLDRTGKPRVARARLIVPAASPGIIESKSLKLYLNSFNQERCEGPEAVAAILTRDLSAAAGAHVQVEILEPGSGGELPSVEPPGTCLDALDIRVDRYMPAPELLRVQGEEVVSECVYSHLLRSLCPVTGQPDWGSVMIRYRGARIDPAGLLAYIISFRQHGEFHEQCVERMFMDISRRCAPESLTIDARYLRRGGLDISPFRSNESEARPEPGRWFRQ